MNIASFKRKYDVAPSNAMTDVTLMKQLTSDSARLPSAFKTVTTALVSSLRISFDKTLFLALAL